jgi:cysteine desulfurase
MQTIYLDNNATSAVHPEVLAAMLPWLGARCGNPSSLHSLGSEAADAVGAARRAVARLIGARSPREILFTSGGTEADVSALRSAARQGRNQRDARRLVGTTIEHAAVLETLARLEREGFEVRLAPCDRAGRVDVAAFEALLDGAPCALATAMWANNETGVVQDVACLGAACRRRGVPFHVDGVQAAGKLPMSVADLPIDSLAISGHKLHGPKGVGALWVRRGMDFEPLITGGPQEHERRAGTENVPGIVGLGRAAELALAGLADMSAVATLRDRLEQTVLESIPGSALNGASAQRLANTTNLAFEGLSGEALVVLLSELGVCASTGSACATGKQAPSHVLLAMGCSVQATSSSVRLSLSRATTAEEIDAAIEALGRAVGRLRALSGWADAGRRPQPAAPARGTDPE